MYAKSTAVDLCKLLAKHLHPNYFSHSMYPESPGGSRVHPYCDIVGRLIIK